jgi:hypothetical protein
MLDKWNEIIFSLIKADVPFTEYWNILIKMKEEGISSDDAKDFFLNIRETLKREGNEKGEDTILEVLDLIEGYCPPHLRVWQTP